jgi:hypothetical protein
VITLGVDLASQPRLTGICEINWGSDRANVTGIIVDVGDDQLIQRFGSPTIDKIGIDIPLGWPDKFVAAITEHHSMASIWPDCEPDELRYRATDKAVNKERFVLSVSSDRIAVPAFRAARLAARLSFSNRPHGSGEDLRGLPGGSASPVAAAIS